MRERLSPLLRAFSLAFATFTLVSAACGQEPEGLSGDASPSPGATAASPSDSPSPTTSPEPYSELAAYESSSPHEPRFRLRYPEGWEVLVPNIEPSARAWAYSIEDQEPIFPAEKTGCRPFIKIEFSVSENPTLSPFPEAEGTMQVGGEEAQFAVHEPGDPKLDEFNENASQPGCLTHVARARFVHAGFKFSFSTSSTLSLEAWDGEDFKRVLRAFEFLP
jgi:hypothetical protein